MNNKSDESKEINYSEDVSSRARNVTLKHICHAQMKRDDINLSNYEPKLHCCIIPEKSREQKKRAHSDSMLYSSDATSAIINKTYFNQMNPESHMDVLFSDKSDQNSGYNFCTWLSHANTLLGDSYDRQHISLKLPSVYKKSTKLTSMLPNSPKKSPKDYWLLKHNSTQPQENCKIFTFENNVMSTMTDNDVPGRTLTTIMDSSPENDKLNIHQEIVNINDVKITGELQCLKHKKYLQNKYQQSSSSMENDDVFIETTDKAKRNKDTFMSMNMDCCSAYSNANKMETCKKRNTNLNIGNNVTFSVFTFPPQNEFYGSSCFSESECGLSPTGLSSIASSPGIVGSPRTFDNSCPISVSLEKFALNSDAPPSNDNLAHDDTTNNFNAHCITKSKKNQNNAILGPPPSTESHSKPCIMPLGNATQHDLTTSGSIHVSNVDKFFMTKVSDNFLHSASAVTVKSEDNSPNLMQSSNETDQEVELNKVSTSTFPSTTIDVVKSKSFLAGTLPSLHSSSSSDSVLACDLSKDISCNDINRNHLCRICDRVFSRSDMLSRHMRLHTGHRPYECKTCGQVFSRSDHLQTHLRTHTGEKPYRCSQCLYAAPRRDMVTRHMRVHNRGKTKKGKRGFVNGKISLPCHGYIILDEKCFTRSKLSEKLPEDSVATSCISSSTSGQDLHSTIADDGISSDLMKSSVFKTANSHQNDMMSLSENSTSKPQNYPSSKFDHFIPLDLSIQLKSYQNKGPHPITSLTMERVNQSKLGITSADRKSQKWSFADVSLVDGLHVTDDRHGSSVTCSPITRSDSTVSVDSGVSYATPSSLIHSVCSPDSPESFSQSHGSTHDSSFFLWPTVVHGNPG